MKQPFRKAHIGHLIEQFRPGDPAPFIGVQYGEQVRMSFRVITDPKMRDAMWNSRSGPTRYEHASTLGTPSHKRRKLARRGGAFRPASRV